MSHGDKKIIFFEFEIIIYVTYVLGLRPLYFLILSVRGDRFYTSEIDVYRRQILKYKNGSHAEMVNTWSRDQTLSCE